MALQADPPAPPDRDALPLESSAQREPRIGSAPRVVHSAALLAGASQLAIMHNETIYFLRQTAPREADPDQVAVAEQERRS
jgi:hemin uptake protein HemP